MKYILIIYWGVSGSAPTITPFATLNECVAARDAIVLEHFMKESSAGKPEMHCLEMKQ